MSTTQPDEAAAGIAALAPTVPRRRRRRFWRRTGLVTLILALALCTTAELAWWRLTATVTNYAGAHFNQGQNAIWIAHTWVGDSHTPADYQALAQELEQAQMQDVFVHVGPLNGDGTIAPGRYPFAAAFIQAMRADAPNLRFLAWLGQIYRIGAGPNDPEIDISLPDTRARVVATSLVFTRDLGFDGVHFDLEPVPNNDNHFLDLLDETRQAIGPAKLISVAAPNWVPVARVADAINTVTGRFNTWWTTYYYRAVSLHCDQIVVMLYNTGMPTAPLYTALAQQETDHVVRAVQVASSHTKVIIGIPDFDAPSSRAFHEQAENIRSGLEGVTAGLNAAPFHPAFAGVAIYPEWLTTSDDWAIYDQLWLGTSG